MTAHYTHNVPKSLVSYTQLGTIIAIFSLVATAMSGLPPTFDDVDRAAPPQPRPGTPNIYSLPFPHINRTEAVSPEIEVGSKYNTVSYSGSQIHKAADLKAKYPRTMVLRYFPCSAYQPDNEGDGTQRSFLSTGPASVGSAVFAGHWLYLPGSKLKNSVDSKALVLPVNEPRQFTAGQYVVIYEGGPGAFLKAEHAKIASVDYAAGTLKLATRGFKSSPTSHPSGAIVAPHELGAGGSGVLSLEHWSYNLGTRCPVDGNGKQMNVVMAEWLASHLNVDRNGSRVGSFEYDGVLFDGERGNFFPDPRADMDNNLVAEGGVNPTTGENMHGPGNEAFYARLRSLIGASKILVGSNGNIRGYNLLNGTQCEGYPNIGASYVYPPNYSVSDQKRISWAYHLHHHAYGPVYSEIISKTPTLLYPHLDNGGTRPTSNSPFRYSFGMALLENGSYGQKRPGVHDPWWDEFSVDITPGSASFGQAIPNSETDIAQIAKVRAHTGWLGSPLGPRTRIFDATVFDTSKNLLPNPGFESGQGQWIARNVKLSLQTGATVFAGNYSLHMSPMVTYRPDIYSASIISPPIYSSTANIYTVCFAVKSSRLREFGVQFGNGAMQTIVSDTSWKPHTLTFKADAGNNAINLYLGRESSDIWFDEIYLFKGNPDVFRRDFQHGTVFVNATPGARTINPNGKFRRIKGTQDPVNNGSSVGLQLTIPAYDSAILVRVP